jgi:hypothetical protein
MTRHRKKGFSSEIFEFTPTHFTVRNYYRRTQPYRKDTLLRRAVAPEKAFELMIPVVKSVGKMGGGLRRFSPADQADSSTTTALPSCASR